jgi:hypothetical protein
MTYNYYIDKRKNHKNDNFININLDYPIECNDNEYLKVKLCSYKYFNNEYNISQKLQNNIITLRKTAFNYTQSLDYNVHVSFNLINEFFDFVDLDAFKAGVTNVTDEDARTHIITGANYILYYYNYYISTSYGFQNIFTGYTSREIDFTQQYHSLTLETRNNTELKILKKFNYAVKYDGPLNNYSFNFRLQVEGSNDNINYTVIPSTVDNTVYFAPITTNGIIETFDNVILENTTPYKYYRFKAIASIPNAFYYRLNKLQLFYVGDGAEPAGYTEGSAINYNLTIPDGFYNSTNIVTKLTEILEPHQIVPSIESTTNKLIFSNNTTFIYNPLDSTTDPVGILEILFPNINIQNNYGMNTDKLILIRGTNTKTDTNINLINFSKIIISTNLNFTKKTHNELISGNTESTGIGNIIAWVDADDAPHTCIKYNNYNDIDYRIENKYISNILLYFYNEKSQQLDLDNSLVHLQIKKQRSKYH